MLFAAGLGTRLKPLTDSCPKALVEVNHKSLLQHNIIYLQRYGIYDIVINVHHFADMIERTVAEHNGYGSNITISDERDMVLETGGGLLKAAPFFKGEECFVVMNVDILTNLDLEKMIMAHRQNNVVGTLAVSKRSSSRQFLFDDEMNLCGWMNNSTMEKRISRDVPSMTPYAFSGVQVLSGAIFNDIPFTGKFSLVDAYLHIAKTRNLKGHDHTGDILIDVGKPESIEKAEQLFS